MANEVNPSLSRQLRARLTGELVAAGTLRADLWIGAFMSVPREYFLPNIYVLNGDDTWYLPTGLASVEERLRMVYADGAWVTQDPTRFSAAPNLIAQMLEALDVTDDRTRALEMGTGAGYNTALLCSGLGEDQVTSIARDAEQAKAARIALERAGFRPALYAADGDIDPAAGLGKVDRLIAADPVPEVPVSWLSRVKVGGVIVAPIYREQPIGAMVQLVMEEPDRAEGPFLPFYGAFMPTRTHRATDGLAAARRTAEQVREVRTSPVALSLGSAAEPWQFYASMVLGDLQHEILMEDTGEMEYWLLASDGSWACQQHRLKGDPLVREGGSRRLWTELEHAVEQWHDFDEPDRERFGLTVTPDRKKLWLDDPEYVISSQPTNTDPLGGSIVVPANDPVGT